MLAFAGSDLAPFNGGGGIQIADEGKPSKVFYPVEPGSYLDYAFSGPGRVWVYVRSGARPKGGWSYPLNMELPLEVVSTRIDGVPLAPGIDEAGALLDYTSTYPWLSKGILIDVPEGSTSFRLPARLDGPPLLVRVMVPGSSNANATASATPPMTPASNSADSNTADLAVDTESEPALLDDLNYDEPAASPESSATAEQDAPDADASDASLDEQASAPDITEDSDLEAFPSSAGSVDPLSSPEDDGAVAEIIDAVPDEPVGEDTFGGRYEIFDEEAQVLGETNTPDDAEEIEELDDLDSPEAVVLGAFSDRLVHSLKAVRLNVGLGLGAPVQGSQPVGSADLSGRIQLLPILTEAWAPGWGRVDFEVSAGWYRVGVRETLTVEDSIAGDSSIEVSYATHVIPILFGLHYDLPVRIGPLLPFVGASGGVGIAQRSGASSCNNTSAIWHTKAGAQFDVGPIQLLPHFAYTGMNATLGRFNAQSKPAAENLSNFRLVLAAQTQF